MVDIENGTAAEHCRTGIDSYVRWQADAASHLDMAIASDENHALPRLVKAWMLQAGRDASLADTVDMLMADAKRCLSGSTSAATGREQQLYAALEFARDGLGVESATVLEQWLDKSPTDVLVHQLIQSELFWMGRASWMCDVTERAAPSWSEQDDGYGSFLALRAFANEEVGNLQEAERFGRMAVEINPADVWGAHAVAHVLFMRGETKSGIDWLENLSPNWQNANQLRHHLWWHMCLFLLETGEHDQILHLLTAQIRNPESELVKAAPAAAIDIQNYASLLMRLNLYGVDVGNHWNALASICANRTSNHGNAFCNIHDMMVLAATGQFGKAQELLESMRSRYQTRAGSVALAYNAAGIPACEAVVAHYQKDYKRVLSVLGGVRHDLVFLGASHAQRDVLYHVLVHAAEKEARADLRLVFLKDIERIGFCDVPQRQAYKGAA